MMGPSFCHSLTVVSGTDWKRLAAFYGQTGLPGVEHRQNDKNDSLFSGKGCVERNPTLQLPVCFGLCKNHFSTPTGP